MNAVRKAYLIQTNHHHEIILIMKGALSSAPNPNLLL